MFYSIYTIMVSFAAMSTCTPKPVKRRYSDYNDTDSDSSTEFQLPK